MNNPNTNVIAPTIRFITVFVSSGVICITFKTKNLYINIMINGGHILRECGPFQEQYHNPYRTTI